MLKTPNSGGRFKVLDDYTLVPETELATESPSEHHQASTKYTPL